MSVPNLDVHLPRFSGCGLDGLVAALDEHRRRSANFLVPVDRIVMSERCDDRVTKDGVAVEEVNVLLAPTSSDARDQVAVFRPTAVAHEQLATVVLGNKKYYDRCAEHYPKLLSENVNVWLQHLAKDRKRRPGRLLRAWRADDGSFLLRAFLSDHYRMLDHHDVAMTALEAATESCRETDLRAPVIGSWDLNERHFDLELCQPELMVDLNDPALAFYRESTPGFGRRIRAAQRGLVASLRAGAGLDRRIIARDDLDGRDWVVPACRIRNSESGHGKLSVTVFGFRVACWNGQTIGLEIAALHLGALLADEAVLAPATLAQRNRNIFDQVRDAVRAAFGPDRLREVLRKIARLRLVGIGDPVAATDVVATRQNLSAEMRDRILSAYRREAFPDRDTAFDLYQAVALAARDLRGADPDLADRLERTAIAVANGGEAAAGD
jgi:hypothetical protein